MKGTDKLKRFLINI